MADNGHYITSVCHGGSYQTSEMYHVLPLLCLLVACVSGIPPRTRWTSNYNDNFDAVLKRVQLYGPQMGLDPMQLPDVNRTVTVNVLFGAVSGGIVNMHGVLTGGTTLRRSGNATARIEGSNIYIDADVDFVTLNYEYASLAQFMGLGVEGKTNGVINDLLLHITLRVELSNPYYGEEELQDLTLKHTGGLTVHFDNGMSILDEFIDSISDVFTEAFKDVIINSVQPEIKKAVEYAIQKIDSNVS